MCIKASIKDVPIIIITFSTIDLMCCLYRLSYANDFWPHHCDTKIHAFDRSFML